MCECKKIEETTYLFKKIFFIHAATDVILLHDLLICAHAQTSTRKHSYIIINRNEIIIIIELVVFYFSCEFLHA